MNILQKLGITCLAVFSLTTNVSGSTDNYFTMLDPSGNFVGGADDVSFDRELSLYTDPATQLSANMVISSAAPQPFLGFPWVIHDARAFGPGNYVFQTTRGNTLNLNVNENQVGAHFMLDWNNNNNIDVVLLWDIDGTYIGSSGAANDLGSKGRRFNLASVDGDNDGISGIAMADGPFAGFSVNLNINPISAPLPTLSIVISGGTPQECTDVGGSTISMNAQVIIPDASDVLNTVSWTLDGSPAASGESVNISVPLGEHNIEATATTILGQSATDSTTIVVEDTIPPAISAGFVNAKTGAEIIAIKSRDKASISYSISDACDPVPTIISATAGMPAENGDTVAAKTSKKGSSVSISIQGNADNVELTVIAKDASGNMSSSKAVLTITP